MASTRMGGLLLLAPLLLSGTGAVLSAPSAVAQVPTCRGQPATIVGTDRDDRLRGTSDDDVIVGGKGLDIINGGAGDDLICGGPSRATEPSRVPVQQTLSGGPGADVVVGGRGDDVVYGLRGADLLIGNGGNDVMRGDYDGVAGAPGATEVLRGGPGRDYVAGDEGTDRLFGGPGPDRLEDSEGANLLEGATGDDVLASGPGDEIMRGGPGRDAVSYVTDLETEGSHCNDVTADLTQGSAHGDGFGSDALQGVERVWTGGGNDTLIGDDGPNGFSTGGSNCDDQSPRESVVGKGGADHITFNGRAGSLAFGGARVDLNESMAVWRVRHRPNTVITLTSIEHVTGTEYRDIIVGDGGTNRLTGGNDNDSLYGGGGADDLRGSRGADELYGGPGRNRNDGGVGVDTCRRPRLGALAISCER